MVSNFADLDKCFGFFTDFVRIQGMLPKFIRNYSKATQEELTPACALQILKEGNQRFVQNLKAHRNLLEQVNETAEGQFPFAAILSCIDSRTSAELIFDQGLGDIFSIRVAGNVLNEDILGSMEFSTKIMGAKIVVVLGHTKCGAIIGACDGLEMGNVTALLGKIQPAVKEETETKEERNGRNKHFVQRVTELNVHLTMDRVRKESAILREMEEAGEISIVGGLYNLQTGKVTFFED